MDDRDQYLISSVSVCSIKERWSEMRVEEALHTAWVGLHLGFTEDPKPAAPALTTMCWAHPPSPHLRTEGLQGGSEGQVENDDRRTDCAESLPVLRTCRDLGAEVHS